MKQTAVEWLGNEITNRITRRNPHDTIIIQTQGEILIELIEQAKEMEKEQELKIKIQCLKESLQFIDVNYMAELLNKRIYNMEKELLTFKSE